MNERASIAQHLFPFGLGCRVDYFCRLAHGQATEFGEILDYTLLVACIDRFLNSAL